MFSGWLVSLLALLVCAVFFVASFGLRTMSGSDPLGPAWYPRVVIVGTALAAVAVLVRLVWQTDFRAAFGRVSALLSAAPPVEHEVAVTAARRVAFAMAISLVYPFAILKVGFFAATAIFTLILMQAFEQRLWISLSMSLILAAGLHFFFAHLLNARVVPGQWFDVMRAMGL